MTSPIPPSTTANSGTSLCTRKSDVDSPIPVVRPFATQKYAVISGTFERAPPPNPLTVCSRDSS
jgi:hypothetical protein